LVSSPRGSIPGQAVPTAPPIARSEALLTFLFTDVEGSTRLWEQYPRAMQTALERHDVLLRTAIGDASGDVVKTTGDGLMAVFDSPGAAVSAAIAAQRALLRETWPAACAIRVRMGIHSGEAEARGGDFFGPAVNRAARIMAVGHGGQVLLSAATVELLAGGLPATASLRDLGEHRLKDLGRPEHLFQLADRDLPSEFPPLATLDRRPNNLPTQASPFVGRDAVLHDLRERLDDRDIRLVTLTGPGGTGKTRLALRAAADQIDRFTDGVFFVDLVPATDGDAVLGLIAAAVGLAETTERAPLNELRRQFRNQQVLLVLDNFEQVAVAGPVLLDLLAECPGLKLLVTSRQALRVRGENVVSVPPLSLPAATAHATSAMELSQFEAIQLFVERARAVRSDFRLTDDNASAVAEICRRLDGLSSLLDKSLVRQAEVTAATGEPRIVMLETIREYAAERLAARSDLVAAARDHHARYFVDYAAAAATEAAAADADAPPDAIALENDNLRIAWRHWVAQRDLPRLKQLKDVLWPLYDRRGWYHATVEVIRDFLGVLATLPREDHWQEELALRTSLARALTLLRGYTGEAEDEYVGALALLKDHPDVPLLFPVLRSLASFHGFRGEVDKAIAYANQILVLADAEGDPSMRVDGEFIIGADTGFGGDLQRGLGYLDEAIRAFESDGYRPRRYRLGLDVRVSCLTTSGFFLWLLGHPDRAVERADRAVEIATEIDHQYSLAYGLFHSGFLHLWRREPERVAARATAAIRVAETSGLPIWRALGTCLLGAATSSLGRPADGLRQIGDGLEQYQDLRTPPVFWPFIRFIQGGAHVEAGTPGPGLGFMDEAIALGGPDNPTAPLFHIVRGDLSLAGPSPDVAAAAACYERGLEMARRLGSRTPQLRALTRLCRIASDEERGQRRDELHALHATFSEGHATPDLREAAELLRQAAGDGNHRPRR
jgi:class 3 adenylate cyclase/predicted ATPase